MHLINVTNALTIDVEEYFQVTAFEDIVPSCDWEKFDSRVADSTRRLLQILGEQKTRATFFVLGWIAERHPLLIRSIREQGHEVACHGFKHVQINRQDPKSFREDVRAAKSAIENVIGEPIHGYRAASFSIRPDTLWALEILVQEGFLYDSSIFPILHDRYGIPDAPRSPYSLSTASGVLVELPPTTIRRFGRNIPTSGGGYFRLFPYSFIKKSIREVNQFEGMPAVFYLHPWEIDFEQPRLKARWRNRIRHYTNLDRTEGRLRDLLSTFRFSTVAEALDGFPLRSYTVQQNPADRGALVPQRESISFYGRRSPRLDSRKISLVIPVYNESENLRSLCQELDHALSPLAVEAEWIFVDDGSTDGSMQELQSLKRDYPFVRIIKLRHNCGQTAAMQAGFEYATGDVVVTMDADLQNDPLDIPLLLRRLEQGYDLVCGWRKNRRDPWLSRKLPSKIANKIIQRIIGSSIHDRGCSLKAYSANLAKKLQLYSDMHRFIQEISIMHGARVSELVVSHRPRRYGTSKYGISRTFKVISDLASLKMLMRFSTKPMVGFFLLALPFAGLAFLSLAVAIGNRLSDVGYKGSIVDVGAAFLFSAQFVFLCLLGLIGEMAAEAARYRIERTEHIIFEEKRANGQSS